MSDFLTEDWFPEVVTAAAGLPKTDGCDAIVNFEIAGAPSGKLRVHAVVADGQISSVEMGKSKEAVCDITIGAENAQAVLLGEIDPAVGYMRGDIKLGGAYELILFEFQPMFKTDEWTTFVATLAAATTF